MTQDNIAFGITLLFILFQLFITYLIAKKYPKLTIINIAFCIVFLTFQINIVTNTVQFYLIWKLYFNWVLKQKENGNDQTDK